MSKKRRASSKVKRATHVRHIRKALKAYALEYLAMNGIDAGWTSKAYLNVLIGLKVEGLKKASCSGFMDAMFYEGVRLTKPVEEAFVFGYRVAPNARSIRDLPGRERPFFAEIMARKDREQEEARKHRKRQHRARHHAKAS